MSMNNDSCLAASTFGLPGRGIRKSRVYVNQSLGWKAFVVILVKILQKSEQSEPQGMQDQSRGGSGRAEQSRIDVYYVHCKCKSLMSITGNDSGATGINAFWGHWSSLLLSHVSVSSEPLKPQWASCRTRRRSACWEADSGSCTARLLLATTLLLMDAATLVLFLWRSR